MKEKLLFFIPVFLVIFQVSAVNPSPGNSGSTDINLAPYTSYLQVKPDSLPDEEILSGNLDKHFKKLQKPSASFGFSNNILWLRVEHKSKEPLTRHYLQLEYPPLQNVTFYTYTNGEWTSSHQGYKVTEGNFPRNPYYGIPYPPQPEKPVYLKLETQGSYRAPLFLKSNEVIDSEAGEQNLLFGLYFGALLMMVLYNLFLFFALRDINYLLYCLFISSNIFTQWIYSGYMHFRWPSFTAMLPDTHMSTAILATIFLATLFAIYFLKTRKFAPRIHKLLVGTAWAACVLSIVSIGLPYKTATLIMMATVALSPVIIWIASLQALRNRNKSARYFLTGWTVYLTFSAAVSLQAANLLPEYNIFDHLVRIGAVLEALLFTLALADRIQLLRQDKERTRATLVHAMQEKERITREQNLLLEQKVDERTSELRAKQEEIMKQASIIEQQNAQLSKYSEKLEDLVKKRTQALMDSNLELVRQNVQLEQYAYITSHNLRGPLANLIGILQIYDRDNLSNPINRECIRHLDKATVNLDSVIKDLSKILDLKTGLNQVFESIDLKAFIEDVVEKNRPVTDKENGEIECNLQPGIKMKTIPSYLHSILYNLISNGTKYHTPGRKPKICISTSCHNNRLEIKVADNGMGIDLEKHANKLFGLYQRFHLHREGKGIGLHLVKTQTELLRGEIEVDSTPGEGTTFRLTFDQAPEPEANCFRSSGRKMA